MKRSIILILLFIAINFLINGKSGIIALAGITLVFGFNIAKNFVDYLKTLRGVYSDGKLIAMRKFKFGEIDNSNYEVELEFQNPSEKIVHKKKFPVFLLKKPDNSQQYKIWINKKDIEKSILLLKFNKGWVFLMIVGLMIWIGFLLYLIQGIGKL